MMYKNNNTGIDIGHEVQDIADLGGYQAETGLISLMELGGPDFSAQRYTFNSSHLLAGNWLWKTGRDADLRVQASGFVDREEQRSGSSLTYLTIDGMPVITEDYSLTNRRIHPECRPHLSSKQHPGVCRLGCRSGNNALQRPRCPAECQAL